MKLHSMLVLAVITGLVPAACVTAADEPENVVKYRKNYMTALGGHVGAIAHLVKAEYTAAGHLQIHADAVAATVKDIDKMFPKGTQIGKTHALPAIWENLEDFIDKAKKAERAAQQFKTTVASGDPKAIGKGLKTLGGSCKGCHEDYKERED